VVPNNHARLAAAHGRGDDALGRAGKTHNAIIGSEGPPMRINIFEGARRITKAFACIWALVASVVTWVDYRPAYDDLWTEIENGARWAIVGVAAIYIFALTIGWIVRGFLGIPHGKDSRAQ
jgi:hypothetical protein